MNEPDIFLISFNGLSIPSKISDNIPGARVIDKGPPVPTTGSPFLRPVVSS